MVVGNEFFCKFLNSQPLMKALLTWPWSMASEKGQQTESGANISCFGMEAFSNFCAHHASSGSHTPRSREKWLASQWFNPLLHFVLQLKMHVNNVFFCVWKLSSMASSPELVCPSSAWCSIMQGRRYDSKEWMCVILSIPSKSRILFRPFMECVLLIADVWE